MDAFVEDVKVQEAAVCVLLQLSETSPGRRAVAADGAIPRVFAAMDINVKSELVRQPGGGVECAAREDWSARSERA